MMSFLKKERMEEFIPFVGPRRPALKIFLILSLPCLGKLFRNLSKRLLLKLNRK
jgi:hypothetical protein